MHPKEMSSDNSSQRYTILNFAKVSVRHRGIAQYSLPHPLVLLEHPLSKTKFKNLAKSHVIDYWERKLRGEASLLPSLQYFNPNFMNLTEVHPIWSTAKGNPHEVSKAVQQAIMLSGRYRTNILVSKWSAAVNSQCEKCDSEAEESLMHILINCSAYSRQREKLISLWLKSKQPIVRSLLLEAFTSTKEYLLQFILDCSVLPSVIKATQLYGESIRQEIFYLTRTWCFLIHQERVKPAV